MRCVRWGGVKGTGAFVDDRSVWFEGKPEEVGKHISNMHEKSIKWDQLVGMKVNVKKYQVITDDMSAGPALRRDIPSEYPDPAEEGTLLGITYNFVEEGEDGKISKERLDKMKLRIKAIKRGFKICEG